MDDYKELFTEIDTALASVENATDSESNYDKISLYYVTMLMISDQSQYMAGVGFEKETALTYMSDMQRRSNMITSTLSYVNDKKTEISSTYDAWVTNIESNYNEVDKRQAGDY